MLKKISVFFERFILVEEETVDPQHALNLAIAAILIEMGRIDNQFDESERAKLNTILNQQYGISDDEISELTSLAEEELSDAVDYYQFTSLINQNFGRTEKVAMIEQLWNIAYSDGKIDSHEEHFLRKIADLLFVPHSEFIKAKLRIVKD
ncbi:TerB family tellurite resistance protein [Aliikangiella marina]|uniref:TerB family tellurite resistance protein n=1 Tax=Aliikangiella marina TaxID=1712262 RepID=A0A545TD26_9GAMM|nr:TerB family tellurite resistance protein [Aliikangiella marina]TQV75123.1 TerB family tellurite resistance protein [Aliikangiella marina]